jgi:hypothetical protein
MQWCEYIKTRSIKLYQYIWYMLLDDYSEFYANIKIYIDNIVIIKKEDAESYAIIRAVFTYKYNNKLVYAFVWIDWFNNIECINTLLNCSIFERQRALDSRWYWVYPISILNNVPKVHFVHACYSSCSANLHDDTNNQYFMNNFFYKTV